MCNIAGYVGGERAAPILIEMMRREEGFAGGFYTGIATIHQGKIHYAKVIGDVETLLKETDAASFPGTIGLIHSRSKSGGGVEWGHPFVAEHAGEIVSAYVGNGSRGFFANGNMVRENEKGNFLDQLGYRFRSRDTAVNGYPTLSDGSGIHMSDLMAQLIQYYMDEGKDAVAAMDMAYHDIPGELVGLLLTLAEPDSISWSRINMPMFVGFAAHGAYLASAPLAFPCDAACVQPLPPMTAGRVYADRYTVVPYREDVCRMSRIDDRIVCEAYQTVCSLLEAGQQSFSAVYKAIKGLFGECDCCDSEPLAYRILYALAKENRLCIDIVRVAGVTDEITAPKALFSIKKN